MKKLTCVLAILAAASTAAVAKDLKQDKKATAPAAKATVMSDSEMDKVTAGSGATVLGAGTQCCMFVILPGQASSTADGPPLVAGLNSLGHTPILFH